MSTQTDNIQVAPWKRAMTRVQRTLHAYPALSPAVILVVIVVAFTIINPRFADPQTLSLLVQQSAVIAALALGQTLIILTSGIDLSVGAVAILVTLVMAELSASAGVPGWLALVVGIVLGTLAGLFNGALVTRVALPPFIVTLGSLSIFTAIGLLVSGAQSTRAADMAPILSWTGATFHVAGFSITSGVVLVLVAYLVVGFALSRTAWGTHVYAVGGDQEAARLSGIRVRAVTLSVYLVAGAIYAFAAWVLVGRAGAATPNGIVDGNLQSITAVIIGGTSLFGGKGSMIGTFVGVLLIGVINNGLTLLNVSSFWVQFVQGALIFLAVLLDSVSTRRRSRQSRS